MPNTYGLVEFPIQVPGADESVSDRLLDVTCAYFKAIINRYGTAAWQSVQPNTLPVNHTNVNDPEEVDFNEKDLPCLYLWRVGTGDRRPERLAEDVWIMPDQLQLFWVFPPARQAFRAFRSQFLSGMSKLLHTAIELGRDPCWVMAGDPDPQAPVYGSVFPRMAGFQDMHIAKWSSRLMRIEVADGKPREYPALHAVIDVEERFAFDLDLFDENKGVTISIPAAPDDDTLIVVARDLTTP